MPDLSILTLPILGATGVILLAIFTGDQIAIDTVRVPAALTQSGYSDVVVTQMLTDQLRDVNEAARQLEIGINVDSDRFDASVSEFEQYLGLTALVTGLRELVGSVPYYVNGEITESGGKLTFTARVFVETATSDVYVVTSQGDAANLDALLADGALRILERVSPYIVAIHYHQQELVAGKYKFDQTIANLQNFILTLPPDNNYLAYNLIGRMHLERAACDALLTDAEKAAERAKAMKWLQVALDQKPDYHLAHLHMAEAYLQSGDYHLADQYFARAVRSDPNFWPTRARWGEALVKQGRIRDAIFQYVAAVEIHPDGIDLRLALTDLYRRAGRPDAALTQLKKAVEIDPDAVYPDLRFDPRPAPTQSCEL